MHRFPTNLVCTIQHNYDFHNIDAHVLCIQFIALLIHVSRAIFELKFILNSADGKT